MLDFCIKRKICRNLYRNLNGAQCGSTTWWPGWIAPAATSRSSCVAWRSRSPAESAAAHRRPRTARCTRNCRWMRAAAARSRCACWRCAQGCSGRPGAGGSPWDPLTNLKENTNGKIGRLAGGGVTVYPVRPGCACWARMASISRCHASCCVSCGLACWCGQAGAGQGFGQTHLDEI